MFEELKKEFKSLRIPAVLLSIALSIYLLQILIHYLGVFLDVIYIILFAWVVSIILEPLVDVVTKYLRIPTVISTALTFIVLGAFATAAVFLFFPYVAFQLATLGKILPELLSGTPVFVQEAVRDSIKSFTDITEIIPSLAQFSFNLITILILSFYLIIEKRKINQTISDVIPNRFHKTARFVQRVIDQSFASFIRIQIIWGVLGGLLTWLIMAIFGIPFAASTSLFAAVLTFIPVIGPIIGLIPPFIISVVSDPSKMPFFMITLVIIQQLIFNVLGPKLLGKVFQINPIIVVLSLLIGLKVAGPVGSILAVPIISIIIIVGREFYNYRLETGDS
ncbi:MAG: AI-2E family transporter [Patescibacteria group bacterium]